MQNSILLDTIKGTKRERPPVWFMRQAGRVLPSYNKLREKYSFRELMLNPELAAQVTLLPVNDLGVDAAILFSDILVIPEALGMKINFTDKGPAFETPLSDAINQIPYLNPDSSKLEHIYKTIALIRKQKLANIPLIGFCGAPFTTFCYMVQGNSANHNFSDAIKLFYNDRETAIKLLEIITELSVEYAVSQARHRIDVFQLFESHAGLLPSDLYIEVILPFVKRITSAVKSKEVPVIFFPKGLGHAISRLHPDVADIVSIDWQFSIVEAWEIIDSKIGLQGNLDPRILSVDNKEIIVKELEKFVPFGRNEYKWIFNTGHGVSPDNTFENVKFVVDWVKNANWYRN
ncbi:MAG: uroporphyrinogen decarboxylase [Bacteroidales bacterium]|jgi:uroporphyrinogen decarboxylase